MEKINLDSIRNCLILGALHETPIFKMEELILPNQGLASTEMKALQIFLPKVEATRWRSFKIMNFKVLDPLQNLLTVHWTGQIY